MRSNTQTVTIAAHPKDVLAFVEQECRISRMAALGLAPRERLVEDSPARLDRLANRRHQRPMQVVEAEHHVIPPRAESGRRAGFEIDLLRGNRQSELIRDLAQLGNRLRAAIDGMHVESGSRHQD